MEAHLSPEEASASRSFLAFARERLFEDAHRWEDAQAIPSGIVSACAEAGYLGAMIPREYGGQDWSARTYGLLTAAVGAASTSLTGLFNVHTMVARSILKWGDDSQRRRFLPSLATGERLGAFALTEPAAGSDIAKIATEFTEDGDHVVIDGKKKWITFGGAADLFLVFGKTGGAPAAVLVERATEGVEVAPIRGMLGFRAAHLAKIEFHGCRVPRANLLGRPGFALSYIAPHALDYGRLSVAFAALGMLRAALEICGKHVVDRRASDKPLIEHATVSELLTDLGVDLAAAELLCLDAATLLSERSPDATEKLLVAKYFTSRAAARHSSNAIQMLGALGCHEDFPLARYYRDTKTMEIIEGSNQIHQMLLGKSFAGRQRQLATTHYDAGWIASH